MRKLALFYSKTLNICGIEILQFKENDILGYVYFGGLNTTQLQNKRA